MFVICAPRLEFTSLLLSVFLALGCVPKTSNRSTLKIDNRTKPANAVLMRFVPMSPARVAGTTGPENAAEPRR